MTMCLILKVCMVTLTERQLALGGAQPMCPAAAPWHPLPSPLQPPALAPQLPRRPESGRLGAAGCRVCFHLQVQLAESQGACARKLLR